MAAVSWVTRRSISSSPASQSGSGGPSATKVWTSRLMPRTSVLCVARTRLLAGQATFFMRLGAVGKASRSSRWTLGKTGSERQARGTQGATTPPYAHPMTHPRWGLQFHWWAVDPFDRVGLFYSAFGPVPSAANAHVQALDEATAWAKTRHPEWFDAGCAEHDCPQHCVIELARAPYLFTWDEEHDDRYSRYGVLSTTAFAVRTA